MMRTAIYARFSTDKQSEQSTGDQVAACRRFAEERGWRVLEDLVVEDAGISGASRHNRPRLLELVARIDEWDVLLAFDFSRLARNEEDLGWIANRLRLHRRQAFEASTGLDLENIGARVMGVMNAEYLKKLRADTHRGLRGRVERGLAAGGLPYGYRSAPVLSGRVDPRGQAIADGYRWEVDEQTAPVVERIFRDYAAGHGLRRIATELNRERVPSPRARASRARGWCPTALRALLMNPLYRGEQVWNRSEWIKDHETGRRRRHERPESEWVRHLDESWRIVPDELWHAVQGARQGRAAACRPKGRLTGSLGNRGNRGTRGGYLLSGLLRCEECGGSFYDVGGRLGCGIARGRGEAICTSRLRVARAELEARVVNAIRSEILVPESVQYVIERALELYESERSAERADYSAHRERLAELESEIERLIDLAAEAGSSRRVAERLTALEREADALQAKLREADAPTPELDPRMLRRIVDGYLADLTGVLQGEHGRRALEALLGNDRLTVSADAERGFRVSGTLWLDVNRPVEPPGPDGPAPFGSGDGI